MNRVDDPKLLAELLGRDRETHIYGLADLEEPYWSNSDWYLEGEIAIGHISVGDDWVTGYAMSRVAPDETLGLLAKTQVSLPSGTWITGPQDMSTVLSPHRRLRSVGPHWRMILDSVDQVLEPSQTIMLGADDISAVGDLCDSDPESAFFLPAMLNTNPFVGIFENELLVAMAGTHVASRAYGVAAIGSVLTRPSHRGRGLGTQVMASICHRLWGDYETIGLNVAADNSAAIAVYESLGFRRAFEYEEIELL